MKINVYKFVGLQKVNKTKKKKHDFLILINKMKPS